jgi:hypothetical protein
MLRCRLISGPARESAACGNNKYSRLAYYHLYRASCRETSALLNIDLGYRLFHGRLGEDFQESALEESIWNNGPEKGRE